MRFDVPGAEAVYDYSLYLLNGILRESERSLDEWPSMPQPWEDWHAVVVNTLIAEQLNYDRNTKQTEVE